jgi:perosamine synthetase
VYHQYTLRLGPEYPIKRSAFIERLHEQGIGSAVYYPQPAHRAPYLTGYAWAKVQLPNTELLTQQVVSIPVHPGISNEAREKIAATIHALASREVNS